MVVGLCGVFLRLRLALIFARLKSQELKPVFWGGDFKHDNSSAVVDQIVVARQGTRILYFFYPRSKCSVSEKEQ